MANEVTKGLDDKMRQWVAEFVRTGDRVSPLLALGYAPGSVPSVFSRLMRTPEILAAIHVEVGRQLVADGAMARQVISAIVQDPETPTKLRGELAVKLLDRAGHVAPRASVQDTGAGKSLHELSLDELRDQRDKLEGEIVTRARVIAPTVPDTDDEAIDLLG